MKLGTLSDVIPFVCNPAHSYHSDVRHGPNTAVIEDPCIQAFMTARTARTESTIESLLTKGQEETYVLVLVL